ncbi:hypothetical protein JAAARDRAFT_193859 [Jaapia argillacea MUCL 33604]|uniref:Uncharacterized protein n=1 Tax=Jaapia argillacea MUCL 33604 TaxID=933084 RepID=A0A067PUK9_9AGAM|nr:hypothetical protein JAAARDRAFT_193859 [Jaapia argillacea MUCL 33604]
MAWTFLPSTSTGTVINSPPNSLRLPLSSVYATVELVISGFRTLSKSCSSPAILLESPTTSQMVIGQEVASIHVHLWGFIFAGYFQAVVVGINGEVRSDVDWGDPSRQRFGVKRVDSSLDSIIRDWYVQLGSGGLNCCRFLVIITLGLQGLICGFRIIYTIFIYFQIISVEPLGVQGVFGSFNYLLDAKGLSDIMLRGHLHDSKSKYVLDGPW